MVRTLLRLIGFAAIVGGIVDAATATDRWRSSASTAQARYTEGVQQTTKDPTQLAVNQQGKLVQNFNAAVQSGRWARGLQRVGKAGWQSSTLAKANNYATGINASADKYQAAIGPVLQAEAQLQSQIAAMPNTTIQDSIARMTAWATGLHQWAQNR